MTSADPAITPGDRSAKDGWHWKEWWVELTGTAAVLLLIVTTRFWAIHGGAPWSDPIATLTIIAVTAGLSVIAISFSPLGRRSGAHLNPAVTFGLWLQKVSGRADLIGYCAAQIAGCVLGVAAARVWGPRWLAEPDPGAGSGRAGRNVPGAVGCISQLRPWAAAPRRQWF